MFKYNKIYKLCLILVLVVSCSSNVCRYKIQYVPDGIKNKFGSGNSPTICLTNSVFPQFNVYFNKNGTEKSLFKNTGFPANEQGFVSSKDFDNCVNKSFNKNIISVKPSETFQGKILAYGSSNCPGKCVVYMLPVAFSLEDVKVTYSKKHSRLDIKIVVKPYINPFTNEELCRDCDCVTN